MEESQQCGNDKHPNGEWHNSEAIAASWERIKTFKQWYRRRKYGCICPTEENK